MLRLYRGHWIALFFASSWRCEITECATGEILPTTATASPDEGVLICLERARELIDQYVRHSPTEARVRWVS